VNKYKSYFSKLMNLALSASQNPKIKNPAFWITVASYCAFVDKNYQKSRELLENAKKLKSSNPKLQSQIALQDMLLLANEYKEVSPEMEAKLFPILNVLNNRKNFRQSNAVIKTCKILSKMYDATYKKSIDFEYETNAKGWWASCTSKKDKKKSKEDVWFTKSGIAYAKAKSLLFALMTSNQFANNKYSEFQENSDHIVDSTSANTVKELLLFMNQSKPSEMDKNFIKLLDKNDLLNILSRRLVAEYRYKEAAETMEQLPDSTWNDGNYNYYFAKNPFKTKNMF
jgi:predicted RNA-binding protein associated with RNAse of E/G family